MPRVILSGIKSSLVITITIHMVKSTTTYIATYHPVSPLVLRISYVYRLTVIGISILW